MIALEVQYPSTNLQALAASVPIGQRGLVHIWGRNDTPVTQALGISWVVTDPDGAIVEEYSDWSYGHGPGDDHEFIGGRFDLTKEGTYILKADLLMGSPDNPVVVDSYEGNLCTVTTELPPEYELIQHTIYPYAYIYGGDVEMTIATFKTDPFTPSGWMADKFAAKLEEEIREKGGRPIEVKVYVDTTPLLWTDFRVEVTSTPLGEGVEAAPELASPLPIAVTVLIIALAIIAVIVVATLMWERFQRSFTRYPELKDVKPGWGKETLILTILDSEEYWERPLTSTEILEEMSEPQLRAYLDLIAEEEVPVGIPWWPLAVGGVVVVGIGIAAAMAVKKRKA